MSYNILNLPDGSIKGYQGLGFNTPTITNITENVDTTAPEDCMLCCGCRGINIWYTISINGVNVGYIGGDVNLWSWFCVPVVKGAVVKVHLTGAQTIYNAMFQFISY